MLKFMLPRPQVEMQDSALGGGPVETDIPKAKAYKGKGTATLTLDFDESDDDVFDEEAENAWASRLTESTFDVNTGEKVSCQLEKGVSTCNFACYFVLFDLNLCFYTSYFLLSLFFVCRGVFS